MRKIFIAEDETITALFIEKTLCKNNFEVCGKTDRGDLVYDLIVQQQPDLLLLDLKLKSDITGLEVVEKMVENHVNIPVVLTTGNSDLSTINSLKEKGVNFFLFKPFSQEELVAKVKEVFVKSTIE